MDVPDLEDLSHPADTQPIENLVLAVDQPRRIRALKIRDAFSAVRARLELAVDGLFAFETCNLWHRISQLSVVGSQLSPPRPTTDN